MAFYTLHWTKTGDIAGMREFDSDDAAWEFADKLMAERDKELMTAYEYAEANGTARERYEAYWDYEEAPVISEIEKKTDDGEYITLER